MRQKIILMLFTIMIVVAYATGIANAESLSDGAYTIGRTTSYIDPDTGKPADGGSDTGMGEAMCSGIVDSKMLLEKTKGKTYITIGLGMMSNVNNIRIQVKGKDGNYSTVSAVLTGSCQMNGDTCNQYRFEVPDATSIISPSLYVVPMGRDVRFFVIPDLSCAQVGTGHFVSTMISKPLENSSSAEEKKSEVVVKSNKKDKLDGLSSEAKDKEATDEEKRLGDKKSKAYEFKPENGNNTKIFTYLILTTGIILVALCWYLRRKRGH